MPRLLEIFLVCGAFAVAGVAAAWRVVLQAIHTSALKGLALKPGMQVVDIGCGPGRLTARIAKEVGPAGRVIGMDVNSDALRAAERHARAAGLGNVEFMLTGTGEGKMGTARFDRAVLVAVLGEITDRPAAMVEIFQALAPGGVLSVTEVALDPHRQRGDEVHRLAHDAGFVVQATFENPLLLTMSLVKPPTLPAERAPGTDG